MDKRGKYIRSEYQRELLRKALAKRIANGEKLGFQKGNRPVITAERNKKISESLKGHPMYKSKARSDKLSRSLKGKASAFKGHKHTEEAKQKNRLKKLGKKPNENQLRALAEGRVAQIGKPRPHMRGENNPAWKGGVTATYKLIRHSLEYKLWHAEVLKRDNYTCVKCGAKGCILEVNHIKSFSEYPDLRFNVENGETVCIPCHAIVDPCRFLPKKDLIVGAGEIGKGLNEVLSPHYKLNIIDRERPKLGYVRYMHICFPYSDEFVGEVRKCKRLYRPIQIIVHSTVPPGVCRQLGAIHSPCICQHPFIAEGLRTFPKMLGGERAGEVADYFRRAGLKVVLFDKPETTEAAKLFLTEYYRECINFAKRVKNYSDKHNLNFHEIYTLPNHIYNEGYQKLGFEEFVRPILQPIMTEISGHCVLPNKKLIEMSEKDD